MRDNLLFKWTIEALRAGLDANGFTDVKIKQNFQPRNTPPQTGSILYIHKIGDHRYGFPKREDYYDAEEGVDIHTETQIYETMFQVSCLSIQDPDLGVEQNTASDIVNMAAHILQSDVTVEFLLSKELSIYRVTNIRNPYFMDDKNRFEASPSFDFTLQHEQVIISTTPAVEDIEFNIERV